MMDSLDSGAHTRSCGRWVGLSVVRHDGSVCVAEGKTGP